MKTHGLTKSRYFRLIGLAVVMLTLTVAAAIAQLVVNIQANNGHLLPYNSWNQVHAHFSVIYRLSKSEMTQHQLSVNIASWIVPILSSIIFFLFFGLSEEARKEYIRLSCIFMPCLKPKFRQWVWGWSQTSDWFVIGSHREAIVFQAFRTIRFLLVLG